MEFELNPDLVPKPEWSRTSLDFSLDGQMAYGCGINIILYNGRESFMSNGFFKAYKDREWVQSLSFCKHSRKTRLASFGLKGSLKIWELKDVPTCEYVVKDAVCDGPIEWQQHSDDVLFFFHNHLLSQLNILSKDLKTVPLHSSSCITQLASSPADPHLLAVGFSEGSINVMNTTNLTCINKLKLHTQNIFSLSWSPFTQNSLLSSSTAGDVAVWTLSEFGPQYSHSTPKKGHEIPAICFWHPTDSNLIVSSNVRSIGTSSSACNGEWNVEPFEDSWLTSKKPIVTLKLNNFNPNIVCTLSLDCRLVFWDLTEKKSLFMLHTISSVVSSFATSPSRVLAVGCTDGFIRLWNGTSSTDESHYFSILIPKKKGPITRLAYHPKFENVLAFGTKEGRVGYFDGFRGFSFTTKHENAIGSLSWGPFVHNTDSEGAKDLDVSDLHLYSCGGGKIYIHKFQNCEEKAASFFDIHCNDNASNTYYSAVAWNPDTSLLAVGKGDGEIDIFGSRLIAKIHGPKKSVISLVWHPHYTSMCLGMSVLHNWLAVGSHEPSIYVYDLSKMKEKECEVPLIISNTTKKLQTHNGNVSAIIWNPHIEGQLASAFHEKSIKVWDVLTEREIATSSRLTHNVCNFEWSIFDSDIIYLSGEPSCLMQWKISKLCAPSSGDIQERAAPIIIRPLCPEKEKLSIEDPIPESSVRYSSQPVKHSEKSLFPFFSKCICSTSEDMLKLYPKFIDMMSSDVENNQLKFLDPTMAHFGLFGSKADLFHLFSIEAAHCSETRNLIPLQYEIFCGNLSEALNKAAENHQLTDIHLAFAPTVSHELYFQLCSKYAAKLEEEGQSFKAVFYLLACHKLFEAIDLLDRTHDPIYAYALARARLPDSDPIIGQLLHKWQGKSVEDGVFELSSLCAFAQEDPLSAAFLLSCKKDLDSLNLATYICTNYGYFAEAEKYACEGFKLALENDKWDVLKEMIQEHSCLKDFEILLVTYEYLETHIGIFNSTSEQFGLIMEVINDDNQFCIWRAYTVNGRSFLHDLFINILSKGLQPHSTTFDSTFKEINKLIQSCRIIQSPKEAQYYLALSITAFFFSLFDISCNEHYLKSSEYLNVFFRFENKEMYHLACCFLFPFDLSWNYNKKEIKLEPITLEFGKNAFEYTLCDTFDRLLNDMTSALFYVGCSHAVKLGSLQNVLNTLLSVTAIDAISAFFAMNLVRQIHNQIISSTFQSTKLQMDYIDKCDNGNEKNETSEKGTCYDESEDIKLECEIPLVVHDGSQDDLKCGTKAPQGIMHMINLKCNKLRTEDNYHVRCRNSALLFSYIMEAAQNAICKDAFVITSLFFHQENDLSISASVNDEENSQNINETAVELTTDDKEERDEDSCHLVFLQKYYNDLRVMDVIVGKMRKYPQGLNALEELESTYREAQKRLNCCYLEQKFSHSLDHLVKNWKNPCIH